MFFVFAWEFCIEKCRGFLVNFFWSPSPTKRSTKNPRKIRGELGAKFGANFGMKTRKIREETFVLQLSWPKSLSLGQTRGRPKGNWTKEVMFICLFLAWNVACCTHLALRDVARVIVQEVLHLAGRRIITVAWEITPLLLDQTISKILTWRPNNRQRDTFQSCDRFGQLQNRKTTRSRK